MPEMNEREKAIECIMATAALAAQHSVATQSGASEAVIFATLKALTMLGVTGKEMAVVTLKSSLISEDENPEKVESLRHLMVGLES